jgi:L-lactate dehydrogenase complex protein LldF
LRRNLYKATHTIRDKRAIVVGEMADWQELREAGRALKERVLRHLDTYLQELEASVQRAGGQVHWARDASEANAIIAQIAQSHNAHEVIKVKSLTTDEIKLNEALAARGIEAIETDLAELIIQLAGEPSSHILVPAIHKNRSEIREIFLRMLIERDLVPGPRELLGTEVDELSDEPRQLTAVARAYLRSKFLSTKVAISGANFAVAETGTVCVVESEGNGRMCVTLPPVLISIMGIEKVIPTWQDLEVFLQLLPRSSTGERMNPYTSLWTGAYPGDGPQEFHLVILDNGRTQVLADTVGRQALNCIRCSACLNICPVYERTGGHAYHSVYPGPIGAILTPQLLGIERASSLPYASSLCGACYDVCPVKINIPEVLLYLRGRVVRQKQESMLGRLSPESVAMQVMAHTFADPKQYEEAQRLARLGQWPFVHAGSITALPGPLGGWTTLRDLPAVPKQSFREWWRTRQVPRQTSDQPHEETSS